MLNRVTLLFVIALLIPAVILPQSKNVLKPDGKIYTVGSGSEVIPIKGGSVPSGLTKSGPVVRNTHSPLDVVDTLRYAPVSPASNFGFYGQEWFIQWFVAPADLRVTDVGINFYLAGSNVGQVEIKLVKGNWTLEQFQGAGVRHWGFYPSNNAVAFNATSLKDNPDATGDWQPVATAPIQVEPWGEDLWSEEGSGWEATPVVGATTANNEYTWVDLSQIMSPDVLQGEIFGIAVKNLVKSVTNDDADRLGVYAYPTGGTIHAGFNGWKFYALGRLVTDPQPGQTRDNGWWSREYVWDMAAVVELYGDMGPTINDFTTLVSGINVGPFTVDADIMDTNPGNETQVGIQSAVLQYTLDSNTVNSVWVDIPLTGTMPNFSGQIPALAPNHWVYYKISATDINNNNTVSGVKSFFIFGPTGANTLIIFNGFTAVTGYPQSYIFGHTSDLSFWGDEQRKYFNHDRWAYGEIPSVELLNNYTHIFEFWRGEGDYNDEVIRQWLEADGSRNYFLAAEEFLGGRHDYEDQTFAAGSFEYDILGVSASYNDVSYTSAGTQNTATMVIPVEGTRFGGPLLTLYNSYDPVPDSLQYNPYYELTTADANWQDAFEVVAGTEVDVNVWFRDSSMTKPTHANRVLAGGNKIVFAAYNPLALNTAPNFRLANYNWIGYSDQNSPWQAVEWFGINQLVDVKEVGGIPTKFDLTQNYPNPFNPATVIKFSIPELSKVSLKVYDVLGKEVVTLLNEERSAGNYEVTFDASRLSSGVYFYSLSTGTNLITKKMILMK